MDNAGISDSSEQYRTYLARMPGGEQVMVAAPGRLTRFWASPLIKGVIGGFLGVILAAAVGYGGWRLYTTVARVDAMWIWVNQMEAARQAQIKAQSPPVK